MKRIFLLPFIFLTFNSFLYANNFPFYQNKSLENWYTYQVNINNKSYTFLFDTGAHFSAIDDDVINEINPFHSQYVRSIKLRTSEDKLIDADVIKVDNVFLGNRKIELGEFSVVDLSKFYDFTGNEIDGIIGLDIIKQYKWEFDNNKNYVNVYDQEDNINYNNCVKYKYYEDKIVLSLSLNGYSIDFEIDSGYNGSVIIHEGVDEVFGFDKLSLINLSSDIAGNVRESVLAVINNLIFNNKYIISRVEARVNDDKSYLGMRFLKRFNKFILNPFANEICFSGFSTEGDPITRRIIGVTASRKNEIVLTQNNDVYLNSLLLKNGDVILKINGKTYNTSEIRKVRKILALEPKIDLVIKRNHQTLYRRIE